MAAHASVGSRRQANVPNPLAAASPLLALAVLALALDAAPDLPWEGGVGVAGGFHSAARARLAPKRGPPPPPRPIPVRVIPRNAGRHSPPPPRARRRAARRTAG